MGTKNCTYVFSVVTNVSGNESDYFNKESFLDLLSENHNFLKIVNLIGDYNLPINLKIIQKILTILNKNLQHLYFLNSCKTLRKIKDIKNYLFVKKI
tara:strand:+ start:3949 stop:4239 length:291 start_codon:yes stop_codon:yes gene_type:complete